MLTWKYGKNTQSPQWLAKSRRCHEKGLLREPDLRSKYEREVLTAPAPMAYTPLWNQRHTHGPWSHHKPHPRKPNVAASLPGVRGSVIITAMKCLQGMMPSRAQAGPIKSGPTGLRWQVLPRPISSVHRCPAHGALRHSWRALRARRQRLCARKMFIVLSPHAKGKFSIYTPYSGNVEGITTLLPQDTSIATTLCFLSYCHCGYSIFKSIQKIWQRFGVALLSFKSFRQFWFEPCFFEYDVII